MDLESINKTKLNGEFIPPARYIELKVSPKKKCSSKAADAPDSLYRVQNALPASLGSPSTKQKCGSKQLC